MREIQGCKIPEEAFIKYSGCMYEEVIYGNIGRTSGVI